jgi:hypothetical protein
MTSLLLVEVVVDVNRRTTEQNVRGSNPFGRTTSGSGTTNGPDGPSTPVKNLSARVKALNTDTFTEGELALAAALAQACHAGDPGVAVAGRRAAAGVNRPVAIMATGSGWEG